MRLLTAKVTRLPTRIVVIRVTLSFALVIVKAAYGTETCPQGPHEPQLSYPRRRISTDERSMLGVTGLNANHVCDGIRTLLPDLTSESVSRSLLVTIHNYLWLRQNSLRQ